MPLEVITLAGNDPRANLAFEEELFARLKRDPAPVLLFYVNSPCVILGRGNAEALWVDRAACEEDGVPVLRRFSAGGAVYHDENCLNFSFSLPKYLLEAARPGTEDAAASLPLTSGAQPEAVRMPRGPRHVEFFRELALEALREFSPGFSATGRGDISLNGRKVSGSAQRLAGSIALYHATLLLACPLTAIERYLPIPPDRPGVAHNGFVTGLAEEGLSPPVADLRCALTRALLARLR